MMKTGMMENSFETIWDYFWKTLSRQFETIRDNLKQKIISNCFKLSRIVWNCPEIIFLKIVSNCLETIFQYTSLHHTSICHCRILQLLSCKDEALLIRWDAFFVLNLGLHVIVLSGSYLCPAVVFVYFLVTDDGGNEMFQFFFDFVGLTSVKF